MRIENADLITLGKIDTDMSASIFSDPLKIDHVGMFSVSLKWTGVMAGDIKLQVSNYSGLNETPDYWEDLSPSVGVIAAGLLNGSAGVTYVVSDSAFKWVRIAFVHSSGSGTLDVADLMTKGF